LQRSLKADVDATDAAYQRNTGQIGSPAILNGFENL